MVHLSYPYMNTGKKHNFDWKWSLSVVSNSVTPWTASIHGIFQARVLEWVAISFSRGSSLTWGSNPGLPHCGQMLYCLSHQGILITLTRQTFVSKVMSLLFHMLSSFVIAFLPRSKCLLISWPTVTIRSDFRAQEDKVCHCVHFFSIYALKWWDQVPWS